MKTFFFLLNILILYVISNSCPSSPRLWGVAELAAVSRFEGIEEFYLELRQRKLENAGTLEGASTSQNTEAVPKESEELKKRICKYILTSDFFDMNEEDWVDTDRRNVCPQLKKDPTIFEQLCRESTVKQKKCCFFDKNEYDYVNDYNRRTISVHGQDETENVFICLSRTRKGGVIKPYFISEVYNVVTKPRRYSWYAGRFIFVYNSSSSLVIKALAEESVIVLEQEMKSVESIYIDKRMWRTSTRENDSICDLTPGEKLRLCTTIFNSRRYHGKVKFFPSLDNVPGDCRKRKVSFVSYDANIRAADRSYEEWMIDCKPTVIHPTNYNNNVRPIYYVSRGSSDDDIFVYKVSGGNIYAKFYEWHTSVLVDER